jgi:hypothetical protein
LIPEKANAGMALSNDITIEQVTETNAIIPQSKTILARVIVNANHTIM